MVYNAWLAVQFYSFSVFNFPPSNFVYNLITFNILTKSNKMLSEKKGLKIRKELFISSSKTKNIKEDYEYIR